MRRRCIFGVGLALTATVVGVVAAGLGWSIARKLTAPIGPRTFSLSVRGVEQDGDQLRVVLDRTKDTEAVGIYNLWFERGGWVQLGTAIQDRGPRLLARTVTGTSEGLVPRAGDLVSWSGIYFATPAVAGLDVRKVIIETPAGPAPAWRVDGDPLKWAIHIHGLGSPRAGTLRGVQVATDLGLTSLVVSYRNDGEGPNVGIGRSTLGATESAEVEAAISYAVRHGAERIVLFGWSMGAAIALQLAHRSTYAPLISGLVLDSPVLDWVEVIKANCRRAGLTKAAGYLAVPWLMFRPLARLLGLPEAVPLSDMNWIRHARRLTVSTLILHGEQDESALAVEPRALHAKRSDVVSLEVFEAGHTLNWNSDSERWCIAVAQWLSTNVAGGPKQMVAGIFARSRRRPEKPYSTGIGLR